MDLSAAKPKLLEHDAKYPFRVTSGVKFDPKAKCPKFSKQLGTALAQADIALLQKYCGSMLLRANTCHGILVIRGTPGGGKSTLVSIVEKIIGEKQRRPPPHPSPADVSRPQPSWASACWWERMCRAIRCRSVARVC